MTREELEKRCFTLVLEITCQWDDRMPQDDTFEGRVKMRDIIAKYLADEIQKMMESK